MIFDLSACLDRAVVLGSRVQNGKLVVGLHYESGLDLGTHVRFMRVQPERTVDTEHGPIFATEPTVCITTVDHVAHALRENGWCVTEHIDDGTTLLISGKVVLPTLRNILCHPTDCTWGRCPCGDY